MDTILEIVSLYSYCRKQQNQWEFTSESKFAKQNFFFLQVLWVTLPVGTGVGGIPVCLLTPGRMVYLEGKAVTH